MDSDVTPGTIDGIEVCQDIPAGSVVLRAVEVVQIIGPDGQAVALCRWQGSPDVIAELGMIEYAKMEATVSRFQLAEDIGD